MADEIKISELEEVDEAWNFPLFEAIFNRRSRRFGWGMEIKEGPNKHKSTHPPMPLDELEEAILLGAATGISGMNLSDMPHTPRPDRVGDKLQEWDGMCNTMMEHVGRTWSSPCGNHGTELFYTNDEGVYLLKLRDAQPVKLQEFASKSDRDKLVEFVRANRVKLFDGRLDLPRNTGAIMSFNLWNCNMPGTTMFMPVADMTEEMINAVMLTVDLGFYIADDRNGMRPCIDEKWIKEGWVDNPMPLTMFEIGIMNAVAAESSFIGHNIVLAEQAMGLGGWMYGGVTGLVAMGGTPFARGLGFRFESNPKDLQALPIPVGIDGAFESFRPPYYKNMDAAVDAIVDKKFGPNGTFNAFGKKPVPYRNRADFLRQVPRTPDKTIQIAKETCRYIWETYGTFPALVPPMVLYLYIQAQHLELEFYDKYYEAGSYLPTHKNHIDKWHKKASAMKKVA